MTGLIETLKCQSCAQSAVADNRHDFPRRPFQGVRFYHSQRGRDRCSRMTGAEDIVFALFTAQKSADAAKLANRGQPFTPAAEEFVGIGLMSSVPDDAVFRRLKNVMEGQGELDGSKSRSQVAANF